MPRNMSFAMTTPQFRDRTKTVTRRLGWRFLKPGDIVMGVEKSQGLKKGETVTRLGLIRIVGVRREPLLAIDDTDVAREGFPGQTADWFIGMFCKANKVDAGAFVNRIEFEYLDEESAA